MFLIDDNQITLKNKELLKTRSEKIIDDIKNHFKLDKIKTTDLANIENQDLTLILTMNDIDHPLDISRMIITNARLWKLVLDRELNKE
jgi:hypothetical protein